MTVLRTLARAWAPMLVLALAACGPAGEEPPLAIDLVTDRAMAAALADATGAGLTARDATGRVVPGLARSWRVSNDGLSIVFRLRPATDATGRALTARDIVASLLSARRQGPAEDLLAGVVRVTAPLPDVVEIGLSTPQPELLELLATPALIIRRGDRLLAAGPYRSAPAGPDGSVLLEAEPRHHGAESIGVPRIALRRSRPEPAIARFQRGEAALVVGGGLDGLGAARVLAPRQRLVLEQPHAVLLLLVNQTAPPLDDPDVRRALMLAIDRAAIGPALFGTQAAGPVPGLSPPGLDPYPGLAEPDWMRGPLIARQEEARRLLAQAGYDPIGRRLAIAVAIGSAPADQRLMAEVAGPLAMIGVDLRLVRRSAGGHEAAVGRGEFELALVERVADHSSVLPFLLPFRCGANRHGVCLPEADRLLAEAWRAPDLATRMAGLASAERLWSEDGAAIGLVRVIGWSLVAPRIKGFAPNRTGMHSLARLELEPDRNILR